MTEGKAGPHSGKRLNQKLKPYVVLQYLLKNTDENVVSSAQDIVAYLEECGIDAERRSVYGTNEIWVRPYEMFNSEVDHEKYPEVMQKYRFEEIVD